MSSLRLENLAIEAFRGLRGVDLDLGADLVVIEGPNEAGKSTVLAFVLALLFPTATPAATRVSGRLDLTFGEARYRVERSGPRPTHRLLDLESGEPLGLERLAAITGHVGEGLYRNVFAIGLGELTDLGRLTDAGVRERVYSAAVMGAGRNAGAASKGLEESAAGLLKPRSQDTVLGRLAGRLTNLAREVRTARADAERYAGLQAERAEAAAAAEASRRAHQAASARQEWHEHLLQVWPGWQARAQALEELTRVEAAEAALGGAAANPGEGTPGAAADAERGSGPAPAGAEPAPATWLRLAPRVMSLAAGLEAFQQSRDEAAARTGELTASLADLRRGLARLGPGWTPERLARFEDVEEWRRKAAAVQAASDDLAERRGRLEGALGGVNGSLEDARRREAQARAAAARAAAELSGRPTPRAVTDLAERLPGLKARAEGRLHEVRHLMELRGELAGVREQQLDALTRRQAYEAARRPGAIRGWAGWAALLALTLGIGWHLRDDRAAAVLALALGAVAALLLWPARGRGRGEPGLGEALAARLEELSAERSELEGRLARATARVGIEAEGEPATAADLRTAERALTARLQALSAAEQAVREHAAHRDDVARLSAQARDLEGKAARLEEDRARAALEWREWCEAQGVPPATAPTRLGEVLAEIDALRHVQERIRGLRPALTAAHGRVAAFRERCAALAATLGLPAPMPEADDELAGVVRAWAEAVESARGAADRVARRRQELEAQVAQGDLALKTRFGSSADAAAAELDAADPLAWEQARAEAAGEAERHAAEAQARSERVGSLGNELERLAASADLATALQTAGRVRAEAQAQVRRWLLTRLAKSLIDETLREYERTKVPSVLRTAARHLGAMTNGRFVRVQATEDWSLRVFTPDDAPFETAALSRGTLEQLYLAVRLGLIESFSEANVALPLILDDVLVNADPVRARAIAGALAEVSERQQLLFLTCHPHQARLVLEHAGGARHVVLAGPAVTGGGA